MEYLVLGVILFVVGIGCTYIYDHFKAEIAEHGGFFKAKANPKPSNSPPIARKTKSISTSEAEAQFERAFAQHMAKARAQSRSASTTVTARDGSVNSTMTIEELIRRLEKMKKDI